MFAACRPGGGGPAGPHAPTCVDVGRVLRGSVDGIEASHAKASAIAGTCVAERWRPDAIACVVREYQIFVCRARLDSQQHDRLREAVCRYQEQFPDETRDIERCEPSRSAPLYERLGGRDGVKAIVDEWVANVTSDIRLIPYFANVDTVALRRLLVDQMCALTDGPCTYGGKTMARAHAGRAIAPATFDAFLSDLERAITRHVARPDERAQLLGIYRAMKKTIVRH